MRITFPPLSLRERPRFFYGWVIIAVLGLNSAISMAMGAINFGLFIKPMGDDLGISRAMFGWALTARQASSGLASPVLGRAIDRFGARWLLTLGTLIIGGGLIALSRINAGWQMVVIFAAIGAVGMGGAQNLMNSVPVAKWFVRKRGRAMALMTLGNPIGIWIFAPLSDRFIDWYGWREAWVILAIIGMATMSPTALLFLRRQPSDMGLNPDGLTDEELAEERASGVERSGRPIVRDEVSWTRSEALHSSAFWRLVVVFSVLTLGQSTLGLHRIVAFVDRGVDSSLVAYAIAAEAGAAFASMAAMGFLFERFQSRYIGAAFISLMGLSAIFNVIGDDATFLFIAFTTFGFGIGGMILLQNYLWPDYFGRQHIGSIRGIVMPFTLLFAGIGPPVAGYVYDGVGSYTSIWLVGAGFIMAAALMLAITPRPQKGTILAPAPVPAPQ